MVEELPGSDAAGSPAPGDPASVPAGSVPAASVPAASVPAAPIHVTRLTHEAASRSAVLWIRLPGGSTHPAWHVWHDDGDERGPGPAAYVVSGPGEQWLPWLPDDVELILRSKETGGRLLTVRATAREISPESPEWDAAVQILRPERLNAVGDVTERWRSSCTIHVLTPHGRPAESPGSYAGASGSTAVTPAPPATAGRRPWHWRGRAGARRNTRRS